MVRHIIVVQRSGDLEAAGVFCVHNTRNNIYSNRKGEENEIAQRALLCIESQSALREP